MNLNDVSESGFKIEEAKSSNALAKVTGPFFAVEGASRNGRFYTRGLWEKTLQRVKPALEDRKLLGFLGHGTPDHDENLENVSHIVTDLHIDKKGQGIGTYEVLDTVPGRALNSLLRAGVKLAVSSRATGKMSNEKRNGIPVVDETSFSLTGFDIVRSPGVKEAYPSLVESLNESLGSEEMEVLQEFLEAEEAVTQKEEQLDDMLESKGEENMGTRNTDDKSILESLAKDKTELESQLTEALDSNKKLSDKVAVLEAKVAEKESVTEATTTKLTEAAQKETETSAQLEELKEAVKADQEDLKAYEALATIPEAEKALDLLEEYTKLGTPEQVSEVMDKLEEYVKVGSVEDLNGIMDKMEEMLDEAKKAEAEAVQKDFIADTGVSETVAAKLLEKFSVEEAKEMVGEVSESINIGSTFGHKNEKSGATGDEEIASTLHESRAARMYKSY